jgi:hypothetical protein
LACGGVAGLGLLLASSAAAAPPNLGLSAGDAIVGQTIQATAQLSESPNASGEVSFEVFGSDDPTCAGPALSPTPAPAPVTGEGEYASGEFTPTAAGAYRWSAHYSGDLDNAPADSACSAISTVAKAAPSIAGLATAAVTVGSAITDVATLSGGFAPGGQLVFRAYGPDDASCTGTPPYEAAVAVNGAGPYSPTGFSPGPGLYRWTVEYAGDENNEGASTACGALDQSSAVSKAEPSVDGLPTSSTIVGSPITDVATLDGGFAPSGQLIFRAYADASCATAPQYEATVPVNGAGSYSPAGFSPGPGVYRWTAEYGGDQNNRAASTACNALDQSSAVGKASPAIGAIASSTVIVGAPITDTATLSGGFAPGGALVFSAYGPGDATCATPPAYEAAVAVNGAGSYSPAGFSPAPGLYRWTVEYQGDQNNEAAGTACGAADQASAVGVISLSLTASASGGTVGDPVTATASIQEGAIPGGQVTFRAFSPGDANCAGAVAFSSTSVVAGNGSYRSAQFVPSRVGNFRWIVSYSGDANHSPTATGCGAVRSGISQARPSIAGAVSPVLTVGTSFRDTATLAGAHSPTGTVTFRIYGPVAGGCAKPAFVNTVAVAGNGAIQSDPFVAKRPGRYSFVASYSGDSANQGTTEACDAAGQVALVQKRELKVKPRARLKGGRTILIRASLADGVSPSGVINFRLYGPDVSRCKGKPTFSGGISVRSNGTYALAKYLATRAGAYRLLVGYSGDQRNKRATGACGGAQLIRVG